MGYTFIFLLGWIIGLLTGLTERLSDKIKKNRKGEWEMARRQANKIVRVQFSEDRVMLFGNSYKTWEMQFEEYLWLLKQDGKLTDVEQVTVSDNEWVSWGGLKWCPEERFQHQLNREGCQDSEPDNPNPRQYKEMTFYKDASTTRKVNKAVSNYKKGIY